MRLRRGFCVAVVVGSYLRFGADLHLTAQAPPTSTGPTLEETLAYIRNGVNNYAFLERRVEQDYRTETTTAASPADCTLTLRRLTVNRGHSGDVVAVTTTDEVAQVPLAVLSQPSVHEKDFYTTLFMTTTRMSRAIQISTTETITNNRGLPAERRSSQSADSSFDITFGKPTSDNRDIATRLSKAFARAAELCCSSAPASIDPFGPAAAPCGK